MVYLYRVSWCCNAGSSVLSGKYCVLVMKCIWKVILFHFHGQWLPCSISQVIRGFPSWLESMDVSVLLLAGLHIFLVSYPGKYWKQQLYGTPMWSTLWSNARVKVSCPDLAGYRTLKPVSWFLRSGTLLLFHHLLLTYFCVCRNLLNNDVGVENVHNGAGWARSGSAEKKMSRWKLHAAGGL